MERGLDLPEQGWENLPGYQKPGWVCIRMIARLLILTATIFVNSIELLYFQPMEKEVS